MNREEIIEKLKAVSPSLILQEETRKRIADWHISEIERILRPITQYQRTQYPDLNSAFTCLTQASNETLKLGLGGK